MHTGFTDFYQWYFLAFIPLETENDDLKSWVPGKACLGELKDVG